MLEQILQSINTFLTGGGDPGFIRNSILEALPSDEPAQEEQIQEPEAPEEPQAVKQVIIPDVPVIQEEDIVDVQDIPQPGDINASIPEPSGVDPRPASEITNVREKKKADINSAVKDVAADDLGLTRTKGQAFSNYLQKLKNTENPNKKGLTMVDGEQRFMMFESLAEKEEKGQSKYEIGYGIKVMDDWLKDDPDKWPRVNNVPVNVRNGMTPDQVDALITSRLTKDREYTKSLFKTWDTMTEEEKSAWQDITYNAGKGGIKMNPKAKAAADAGYTMEGLVKLFDFTKAGKQRYRGLFLRRLNMYNDAALSVSGAPIVEEYEWDNSEVWVKFSSRLMSEKFSDKFKKQVNSRDGWYRVPGKGGDPYHARVGSDYQFQG